APTLLPYPTLFRSGCGAGHAAAPRPAGACSALGARPAEVLEGGRGVDQPPAVAAHDGDRGGRVLLATAGAEVRDDRHPALALLLDLHREDLGRHRVLLLQLGQQVRLALLDEH